MDAAPPLSPTERSTVRRGAKRARTDRAELHAVLDAGLVGHLAVVIGGAPVVLPTGYGRHGDTLYLHGSTGAATLRAALAGGRGPRRSRALSRVPSRVPVLRLPPRTVPAHRGPRGRVGAVPDRSGWTAEACPGVGGGQASGARTPRNQVSAARDSANDRAT